MPPTTNKPEVAPSAPETQPRVPEGNGFGFEQAVQQVENLKRENTELRAVNERAAQEIFKLQAELGELRRQDNGGLPKEVEALVKEKVAAGLPRAQAIEVARAQIAWDREQEKAKAKETARK